MQRLLSLSILTCFLLSACQPNELTLNTAEFPKIDSLFLADLRLDYDGGETLNRQEIQSFVSQLKPLETNDYLYEVIPDFLFIDSLKSQKEYLSYLEHIDIGMVQDALAYQIKMVDLNEDHKAVIWRIYYSSYEACPYFLGNDIYLSVLKSGNVISTIQIGSDYSVVDPPGAYSSNIYSHFENEMIYISMKQEEIEMAEIENGKDIIVNSNSQSFAFNIIDGKFQE